MSTDYATKERAFLDSLKADTGRDLGEWMQAIAGAQLPHRNDTIDWLRQHGFPFSRASWLERIHHNGGRPIYADAGNRPVATRRPKASAATSAQAAHPRAPAPAAPLPSAPVSASAHPPAAQQAPGTTASATRPPMPAAGATVVQTPPRTSEPRGTSATVVPFSPAQPAASPANAAVASTAAGPAPLGGPHLGRAEIAALLAPAKAYRPLAQYLIAAIERAVPGLVIHAADGLLILSAPEPFAAILPGPRDIRLGLDAGDAALGSHMLRSRLPGAPATLPHTIVLDDARQVNPDLIAAIESARRRGA